MKILVTGHNGFIGSHLFKKLEELGHDVTGFSTKEGDICKYDDVEKFVKDKDAVFHLAGMSRMSEAQLSPNKAFESIYSGTENVAKACEYYHAKVIYTSTNQVYGDGVVPTVENVPLRPVNMYGSYKMMAEMLLSPSDFIARLGNVYGPSEKSHSVVNRFIDKIKNDVTIRIYNNLRLTRDFVYIDDVVDALVLGIDNFGIYNIGSGVETSIGELLDKISKILKKEYKTVNMDRVIYPEVLKVWLDIQKIRMLGWEPKVNLDEGIRRCIDG